MSEPFTVEMCALCPFGYYDAKRDDEYECERSHPDAFTRSGVARKLSYDEAHTVPPPAWCPLRPENGGPVLVVLREESGGG